MNFFSIKHLWVKWLVAVAVSVLAIRASVDVNLLHVAVRYMAGGFSVTPAAMEPAVHSYGIACVVGFVLHAFALRRCSLKRLLLLSLAGYLVASVLCGMAVTVGMLLLVRILQGLAAGGLLAAVFPLLFDLFPSTTQLVVEIVFIIITGVVGLILAPSFAGYVTDEYSWHWIFYLNLPLAVPAAILTPLVLPKDALSNQNRPPLDAKAIAVAALALGLWNYSWVP